MLHANVGSKKHSIPTNNSHGSKSFFSPRKSHHHILKLRKKQSLRRQSTAQRISVNSISTSCSPSSRTSASSPNHTPVISISQRLFRLVESSRLTADNTPFALSKEGVPSPVTLHSLVLRGKHKGEKLFETPSNFHCSIRNHHLLRLHPGFVESLSALERTPFYATFTHADMSSYSIDKSWPKKYDLAIDKGSIPPHFGIGQNLRFSALRHSILRYNYFRTVIDKAFFLNQLIFKSDSMLLIDFYNRVNSIEDFLKSDRYGTYTLPVFEPFDFAERSADGKFYEYTFDQLDDEGNLSDAFGKELPGDAWTLSSFQFSSLKRHVYHQTNDQTSKQAETVNFLENEADKSFNDDVDFADFKDVEDVEENVTDQNDQERDSSHVPLVLTANSHPTTPIGKKKKLNQEQIIELETEFNAFINNISSHTEGLSKPQSTNSSTSSQNTSSNSSPSPPSSPLQSSSQAQIPLPLPKHNSFQSSQGAKTKTKTKTKAHSNLFKTVTHQIQLSEAEIPEELKGLQVFELRTIVNSKITHFISMFFLDLFADLDIGFSDVFYRKLPSPALQQSLQDEYNITSTYQNQRYNITPVILSPIITPFATQYVKTSLNKHVRDYLEPYMEVPDSLPPNFVFTSLTTINNKLDAYQPYLTGLSMVDGAGNEFSSNIRPNFDKKSIADLHQTGSLSQARMVSQEPFVSPEVALDGTFQWLFHPSSQRTPLHFTPDPNYVLPLHSIKTLPRIRQNVTSVNARPLEMITLPLTVRKLFESERKSGHKQRVSYNFLSGTLVSKDLNMVMNEKSSLPIQTRRTREGTLLLYVNPLSNGIGLDSQGSPFNEVEIVPTDDSLDKPFTSSSNSSEYLHDAPVDPVLLVGPNIHSTLVHLDTTLRLIDYKRHGSPLPGYTSEMVSQMTPFEREALFPKIHRDLAPNSYRNALFKSGISSFDPLHTITSLYACDAASLIYPTIEHLHAVAAQKDRPLNVVSSLLEAHLTRDLFFLDGIIGAFFRAELHRAYDTTITRGSYHLLPNVNYPEELWKSNIEFSKRGNSNQLPLKYDFKTQNFTPQASLSQDEDSQSTYNINGQLLNSQMLFSPLDSGFDNQIDLAPSTDWFGVKARIL